MDFLLNFFLPVAAAVAAIVGLGKFLDLHSRVSKKKYVASRIRRAKDLPLAAAAVDITTLAYTSVFGRDSLSLRFIRRSTAAYFVIIVVYAVFLAAFFPAAFFNVLSSIQHTETLLSIYTCLLLVAGIGIFWAANAQTLYFLRLAQANSKFSHILLILYADVLLTISICAVGVSGLLTAHTTLATMCPPETVRLRIQVRPADKVLNEQLRAAASSTSEGLARTLDDIVNRGFGKLSTLPVVQFENKPSLTAREDFYEDMELLERYLERSGGPRIIRYDDTGLQFLDRTGKISAFATTDSQLHTATSSWYAEGLSPQEVCQQIIRPSLTEEDRYVNVLEFRYPRDFSVGACAVGRPFEITARVEVNRRNVDYSALFPLYLVAAFHNISQWGSTGFLVAGHNHPLRPLNPVENFDVWRHTHVIEERRSGAATALDATLLDSFLIERGKGNLIKTHGFPSVFLIVAVMGTSAVTFMLLVASALASVGGVVLRLVGPADRWLKLGDSPFTIIATAVAVIVVTISVLASL